MVMKFYIPSKKKKKKKKRKLNNLLYKIIWLNFIIVLF